MKKITKILSLLLVSVLIISTFAACGSGKGNKTVKIGVLVADVSGEEALGFADYYKNYIAKNYDVE
ncbi:MAG: sugar ABC transporter substrate-binding protein, partial [Clostridia bacterium]|nr:sugar ABC transporter substrate-binding protein [Clostridia bacterium]